MSSRIRLAVLALACLIALPQAVGSADKQTPAGAQKPRAAKASSRQKQAEPWDPAAAAREYRWLQFELALAGTGNPYMVLDLDRGEVLIKVRGTVVWNARMEVAPGDSNSIGAFVERFRGDQDYLVRMVESRHLFAAKDKTPDSILAIVGEVVKADPQLLQRDIPERFQMMWGWDLVLDVRTDIVGSVESKWENTKVSVIEALRRPFGEVRLKIRLASDDALTLYRIAAPGLPTLVFSSH
jgi:hypothetical protein